ncbi:MAG: peptidoglycan-binding domain-containing protein [Candidatus Staskawiczbacteria bacterium]|nr:peptidoglycan-binding domain-containing protein [Candidatus Staskawiczbacteria bacterium]
MLNKFYFRIFFIGTFLFVLPLFVSAQNQAFKIDSNYDLFSREQIEAELIKTTPNLHFYAEKNWWQSATPEEQNNIKLALFDLGEEFRNKIYPVLTSTFGSEPKPGIDRDEKITVLIHQMPDYFGGYFRTGDIYSRLQYPASNEREMVYLNSRHITGHKAKSFLAHEFVHLITVNQKDLLKNTEEEVWLNEARAEYAPTLLGYDNTYTGSNLETRVKGFIDNPTVSLAEWLNVKADYGAVNLFAQYLVDHYGVKILVDSLHSDKIGIPSLEETLLKNGVNKTFSQIFSDWAIALLVNDCRVGEKYCYLNQNLRGLRIVPTLYFLPKTTTILSTVYWTTYWSLNWHRFVGGDSNLTLEFDGGTANGSSIFQVPYVLCDTQNLCSVGFLILNSQQKAKLTLAGFSQKYSSLTIIPFLLGKTTGFNGKENNFSFSWKASVSETPKTGEESGSQTPDRISELQEQIRQLKAQIAAILSGQALPGQISCSRFNNNLYFGLRNNTEVRCLQEFLKREGVYPEGLVTGNFLSLTQAAVIRFQEKHASEILAPLGLQKGTGYVGPATITKINQLF